MESRQVSENREKRILQYFLDERGDLWKCEWIANGNKDNCQRFDGHADGGEAMLWGSGRTVPSIYWNPISIAVADKILIRWAGQGLVWRYSNTENEI